MGYILEVTKPSGQKYRVEKPFKDELSASLFAISIPPDHDYRIIEEDSLEKEEDFSFINDATLKAIAAQLMMMRKLASQHSIIHEEFVKCFEVVNMKIQMLEDKFIRLERERES